MTPARFSTSSPTYLDIPGAVAVVPPSPGQRWLFLVTATLESSSLEFRAPNVRYLVDGVERSGNGETVSYEESALVVFGVP